MDQSPNPGPEQPKPSLNPDGTPQGMVPTGSPMPPAGESAPPAQSGEAPPKTDGVTLVEEAAPAEDIPLTPVAWLKQNAIYLAMITALVVWLLRSYGLEGLKGAALTAFGIGFIIFVHELGHFMVAKWCDVHVITFSIGFGPAIPGCSFKRGETTYKVGLFPLGGYVNMVGEGSDAEENADYPRSFQNKTVWQRMAIISAGVIMNVIFGALCFIFVLRTHGLDRTVAVVDNVEPGSPAWEQGVRTSWKIISIDENQRPTFEDLRAIVTLSGADETIAFGLWDPNDPERKIVIGLNPRRGDKNLSPIIGVAAANRLQLWSGRNAANLRSPVLPNSAAAAARVLPLNPGDVVIRTTSAKAQDRGLTLTRAFVPPQLRDVAAPLDPNRMSDLWHDLKARTWDYAEFARRLSTLSGQPMKIVVVRAGKTEPETLDLPAEGFNFDDRIAGMTDPGKSGAGKAYNPFAITDIAPNPRDPESAYRDLFDFRKRMRALAAYPVIVQVERDGKRLNVFVPLAYHKTFGARMEIGEVAAVRGPANDIVLPRTSERKGDRIAGVELRARDRVLLELGDRPEPEAPRPPIDPVRLPLALARAAACHDKPEELRVKVWVTRPRPGDKDKTILAGELAWDASWNDVREEPINPDAPMSIPQLGIAYWVTSKIESITPGSPIDRTRGEKDSSEHIVVADRIGEVRAQRPGSKPGQVDWGSWAELYEKKDGENIYEQWARPAYDLDDLPYPVIEMKVYRTTSDGSEVKTREVDDTFLVRIEDDRAWPRDERGFILAPDRYLYRSDTIMQALGDGLHETKDFIQKMYLGLRRVFTGRVSTKTFGGPVEIVSSTFLFAMDDIYKFILFMAVLSINLAVVNFLPIPLLDGGHMVFLIYEKLRGKPASERVRTIATYIGLALLLTLMVYVFYLDISRRLK